MRDRGGDAKASGDAVLVQAHPMFPWWHRVRRGTRQRSSCRAAMTPLRRAVERLVDVGSRCGVPKTAGMCQDILQRREALWTFVQVEDVEPTNHTAERAIRPGVLWRQGSFGTQSAEGARCVASRMTVVATLQQQQRSVLESLTAACAAALRGEESPSLLPASDRKSKAAA